MRDVTLNPQTVTLVVTADADYRETARGLAASVMDTLPNFESFEQARHASAPLLLNTDTVDLMTLFKKLQVEAPPELPVVTHTSAVWELRGGNGRSVMVAVSPD